MPSFVRKNRRSKPKSDLALFRNNKFAKTTEHLDERRFNPPKVNLTKVRQILDSVGLAEKEELRLAEMLAGSEEEFLTLTCVVMRRNRWEYCLGVDTKDRPVVQCGGSLFSYEKVSGKVVQHGVLDQMYKRVIYELHRVHRLDLRRG